MDLWPSWEIDKISEPKGNVLNYSSIFSLATFISLVSRYAMVKDETTVWVSY